MTHLRQQARQHLTESGCQHPLKSEVELTALNLVEEFVRTQPEQALTQAPQAKIKSPLGQKYAQALATSARGLAGAAAGHALNPALTQVLNDVRWNSIDEKQPGMTMLGTIEDAAIANKAVSPQAELDWDVKVSGHWNQQQLDNVTKAVNELSEQTGTKAMTVLREVHLRTHLGSLEEGPILGVTRTMGPVALRREQTEHLNTTRWLLFHEVGHQVDRALSGGPGKFRSHAPDAPFGKSDNPDEYIDPHQLGCPHEDFADCHARLIMNMDGVRENPDLHVHGRGALGEKMAWIRKTAYREETPEPSSAFKDILNAVKQKSPFADKSSFFQGVNTYLDSPAKLPAEQRDWVRSRLDLKRGSSSQ
jgi:hypothetical protein